MNVQTGVCTRSDIHDAYLDSVRDSDKSVKLVDLIFRHFGIPDSFLDVGCGPGHFVTRARELGASAYGIDMFDTPGTPGIVVRDLSDTELDIFSEMVVCFELAEHLPENRSDHLCTQLYNCTNRLLLFSAAQPDQGGSGHQNEQPLSYWRDKLVGLGFKSPDCSELKRQFENTVPDLWWYYQNLMIFSKEEPCSQSNP